MASWCLRSDNRELLERECGGDSGDRQIGIAIDGYTVVRPYGQKSLLLNGRDESPSSHRVILAHKNNEIPRERDFVAAGVPARAFSVGNAAVWSVKHPRSLRTLPIWFPKTPMSRGCRRVQERLESAT